MDDLDREPAPGRQPLQAASEAGAFRDLRDDERLVAQVRQLQSLAERKRIVGGERHPKGFAMNPAGRYPCRANWAEAVSGPHPTALRRARRAAAASPWHVGEAAPPGGFGGIPAAAWQGSDSWPGNLRHIERAPGQ